MRIPSGDLAPARRRKRYGGSYGRSKRRTGRVLLALAVLAGGGAAAYALQRDDAGAPARVALLPVCPRTAGTAPTTAAPVRTAPAALPQPRQVKLLLLNGTQRNGLGRNIGNQLAARGFQVSGTGNAPALLNGASQVSYGAGALPGAQVVARHVIGVRLVEAPRSPRGTLQLVLGSGFARLATPAEVARASRVAPPAAPAPSAVAPAPRPSGCR